MGRVKELMMDNQDKESKQFAIKQQNLKTSEPQECPHGATNRQRRITQTQASGQSTMDVEYQIEYRNFLIDQYEKENEQADMQITMMAEAEMARKREEDKMYDEMIKNYENNRKRDVEYQIEYRNVLIDQIQQNKH